MSNQDFRSNVPNGHMRGLTEEEAVPLARHGKVKAWKCDYYIRTRNGQPRWIADSAIELFGESGMSYGSIGIMQDVTARKQLSEALVAALESTEFGAFTAGAFYLYLSERGPGGSIYTRLAEFPLAEFPMETA